MERNMKVETKTSQVELRNRMSDFVPFVDSKAVEEAVRAIRDGMYSIRHRAGEIVYPYPLSPIEIGRVRELIRKKDGGLISRIGEFTPIRLEEGIGTAILIREKGPIR